MFVTIPSVIFWNGSIETGELMSVREYLNTSYRPDRDYVDGAGVQRNLGEFEHRRLQLAVANYFYILRKQWGIHILPKTWRCTCTGLTEVKELRTGGPEMVVPLDALFG